MHLLYLVLTHWAVASLATTADAEKRQLGVLKTCKLPSLPYCCGAIEDGSSGRTLYSNSCACFQRREAKPKLTSDHRQAEPPRSPGRARVSWQRNAVLLFGQLQWTPRCTCARCYISEENSTDRVGKTVVATAIPDFNVNSSSFECVS
jgi:hypothetical protein